MRERWNRSGTCVFNLGYRIIWCSKYRRKVLQGEVVNRLENLLLQKASQLMISIDQVEIMPDHVRLFLKSDPVNAPHYIVQQLKGYTSRSLRQEFKHLRTRLPTLWTRSYYVESIGHISQSAIEQYIEGQKNK